MSVFPLDPLKLLLNTRLELECFKIEEKLPPPAVSLTKSHIYAEKLSTVFVDLIVYCFCVYLQD